MKNTEKNTITIAEALASLTPRAMLEKKAFPAFYDGLDSVLDVLYSVYRDRENGTSTSASESQAMSALTAFLHTLGKVNGKFISVADKVATDEGAVTSSTLFDCLVYHSFADRIFTTSATLASLELKKAKASKRKAEAHRALIDGAEGAPEEYKRACTAYDKAVKAVKAEQAKQGAEGEMTAKAPKARFVRFVTSRLRAVIFNRKALTAEEAEAIRKMHNKETKEARTSKRKAQPSKRKATATATTEEKAN